MTDDTEERELFAQFSVALETASRQSHDHKARRAFLERHRAELVLFSFWMNELGIIGGQQTVALTPPKNCEQCGTALAENGLFIDGEARTGAWSYMCMPCYTEIGRGIGWGVGQLYRLQQTAGDEPIWVCIAGGDPTCPRDE